MIYSFYILYIFCGAYFFFKKRDVDYFLVSFVGCSLYFLPGFFGETAYLSSQGWVHTPIHWKTYTVMLAVLASITFFAVFNDLIYRENKASRAVIVTNTKSSYLYILSILSIASLLLLYVTTGGGAFGEDKSAIMSELNRWHILFYMTATIGLPFAVLLKRKFFIGIFLSLLVVNLLIGFRSPIVIAALASIVMNFNGKKVRLVGHYKKILFLIFFALLMFLYKYIAMVMKSGLWDIVFERLYSLETYKNMIIMSEPFVVLNNLNKILILDYHSSAEHIYSAIYQLIIFSPELGAQIVSFNDIFQPDLFPKVDYGLASNIWAQFYSAFDWLGVIFIIILYCFILFCANFQLRRARLTNVALYSSMFVYLSFYIHRNDLGYAINLSKRVFIIVLLLQIVVTIAFLPSKVNKRKYS